MRPDDASMTNLVGVPSTDRVYSRVVASRHRESSCESTTRSSAVRPPATTEMVAVMARSQIGSKERSKHGVIIPRA